MGKETNSFDYRTFASYLLPKNILKFFDVTGIKEEHTNTVDQTGTEIVILHISLDELDNREQLGLDLKPNGFTESREVTDFPIRDHKVVLHVRRRRWLDADGHNVVFNNYELAAAGTGYSKEFADVLKKYMDTFPITASSLARYFKVDAGNLSRSYKQYLSGFTKWDQTDHADKWLLLEQNMGTDLSIDETQIGNDVRTILTNKDGHGRKGSLIAIVKGTDSDEVVKVLLQLPEDKRNAVKEVTMDFSDSMYSIVQAAFPNATIVIDCFHIFQRCIEAIEELRLKLKRKETAKRRREEAAYKRKQHQRAKRRAKYRATHPKNYKGEKRGRKPMRLNARFVPERLSNGDTMLDLLTRGKRLLAQSGDKWGTTQKARAALLFKHFPELQKAYGLVQSLRSIFGTDKDKRGKKDNKPETSREEASVKLDAWCQKVTECTLREVKSARDCILEKRDEVLNYFIKGSTNASAESINAKMKGFRSEIHGIQDLPFFLFRCTKIFG